MDLGSLAQITQDKLAPKPNIRWGFTLLLVVLYALKVIISQSHALISYCVGVYLVHGFIMFATPKDDRIPDPFEIEADDTEYCPLNIDNDLKPFIRNMPEYSFWVFCTKIIGISLFLTFFAFTDIPVYVPILVVYFIFMMIVTGFKLWQHSRKYNYNPFFQSKSVLKE